MKRNQMGGECRDRANSTVVVEKAQFREWAWRLAGARAMALAVSHLRFGCYVRRLSPRISAFNSAWLMACVSSV